MSTTFIDFQPSNLAAFSFQPTLNGTQYTATITYNLFSQGFYLNLYDLSNTLIVCRAIAPSGPQIQASFTWANRLAIATTASNHNVPIGTLANVRTLNTNTAFDGQFQVLSTGPQTLSYAMPVNPNQPVPLAGTVSFDLNLVFGYVDGGLLVFHEETGQFEYS